MRYPILLGTKSTDIKYPQNSSMIICLLSLPRIFSELWDAMVPIINRGRVIMIRLKSSGLNNDTSNNAIADPTVPGAYGKYPANPRVAIR